MSMNFRVLPPVAVRSQTLTVNGRNYTGAPGVAMDVPDFDAQVLGANGWICCCPSGPTSARPTTNPNISAPYTAAPSSKFYDTSIGKMLIFDGATWRDPATGNAV
jgi:hypothetical protein